MSTTVFHYPACSTCRKALKWLEQHQVAHERIHIVEQPPSTAQLAQALTLGNLPLRALFNTSGQSYRDGNFKERLASMTQAEALAALAKDGKLIKRPLLLSADFALAGFDESAWSAAFG